MGLDTGRTATLALGEIDALLAWVDAFSAGDQGHVMLISRLPQRRLLEHVHLERVEAHWLTTQDVAGSIQPSLESIHALCASRFDNHEGLVVIEGLEWLISLHGFDEVLSMVMRINDSIHRRPWSALFALDTGVLDPIQLNRLHAEAPPWSIPSKVEAVVIEQPKEQEEVEEAPLSEDSSTPLAFLVRISREGYSKDVARRRILQWRRMGLDVSAAEPALFQVDDDVGFEIFSKVEMDVRRAVELDNRLDILLEMGFASEVTKMRFRVRQLTGFDEVESRIDELI